MSTASWRLGSLALALLVSGNPPVTVQEIGPARLDMQPPGRRIPLSGMVRLRLFVAGTAKLQVQALSSARLEPSWQLTASKPSMALVAGRKSWQQDIQAEPLHPGALVLELPPLRFREGDGPWQRSDWKPIAIKVHTAALADVNDLRDIAGVEALPERTDRADWMSWLGVAAGAVVLAGLVFGAWRWRKTRRLPAATPEERARHGLERIAALGLENGQAARLHGLLYDVVRCYLQRRMHIPARARTSTELRALWSASSLTPSQRELLDRFFERCDRARFAGAACSAVECRETAELARRIIVAVLAGTRPAP